MGRYLVTGTHAVFDTAPGDVLEQDIPADQEARLLASGAIEHAPDVGAEPPSGTARRGRGATTPDPGGAATSDPSTGTPPAADPDNNPEE